jgi:hypothetical protein
MVQSRARRKATVLAASPRLMSASVMVTGAANEAPKTASLPGSVSVAGGVGWARGFVGAVSVAGGVDRGGFGFVVVGGT